MLPIEVGRGPNISASPSCAGFTLIELMVVLVLIAIISAVIIPEMRGTYQDALLRSTSRELVSVFDTAASCAVSRNVIHRVRLDLLTNKYQIERPVREKGRVVGFKAVPDLPGGKGELDRRISIEIQNPDEIRSANRDTEAPDENPAPPVREETQSDSDGPMAGEVISFQPDGTADERQVVLRDRAGFRLALHINPTTARVEILELARQ